MSKFEKINGKFIKKNKKILKNFELGHTYVPISNKDDELKGCIIIQVIDENEKEKVIKQYKHSLKCSLCKNFKKKK